MTQPTTVKYYVEWQVSNKRWFRAISPHPTSKDASIAIELMMKRDSEPIEYRIVEVTTTERIL